MGTLRLEAVYEHGTLKLPHELPLQEGQRVLITIQPGSAVASPRCLPASNRTINQPAIRSCI